VQRDYRVQIDKAFLLRPLHILLWAKHWMPASVKTALNCSIKASSWTSHHRIKKLRSFTTVATPIAPEHTAISQGIVRLAQESELIEHENFREQQYFH
jgi:hypothetical protein